MICDESRSDGPESLRTNLREWRRSVESVCRAVSPRCRGCVLRKELVQEESVAGSSKP